MEIPYVKIPAATDPFYATSGSAGFDVTAVEDGEICPGETKVIPTGLRFEVPSEYYIQIVPRSGLALRTYSWIKNSPGILDNDYRGELGIVMHNGGNPYLDFGILITFQSTVIPLITCLMFFLVRDSNFLSCLLGILCAAFFSAFVSYNFVRFIRRSRTFFYQRGDRLAQCIVSPYMRPRFVQSTQLSETQRGSGGFGSTGLVLRS